MAARQALTGERLKAAAGPSGKDQLSIVFPRDLCNSRGVNILWGDYMKVLMTALAILAATTILATAHGGGCRKSSPPGQCCHMDNSTGSVHCH